MDLGEKKPANFFPKYSEKSIWASGSKIYYGEFPLYFL